MRPEEITVETIDVEPPGSRSDLSPYETVIFRVLPADHPNSFTVPISVNLSQFGVQEAQAQARFVFHRLMRSLAEATGAWDKADEHEDQDQAPSPPASATDARLGPAADPVEGKR
jgi:hypothetical protein